MEVFRQYQTAMDQADGEVASGLVTQGTLDTYRSYRDDALNATREEVSERSIIHRMQVILARATIPAEDLRAMTGRDLLTHAINTEWVAANPTQGVDIGEIETQGGRAVATVKGSGTRHFVFLLEEEGWRLDLIELLLTTEKQMTDAAAARGHSEDVLIAKIVEQFTGENPGPQIWEPLSGR